MFILNASTSDSDSPVSLGNENLFNLLPLVGNAKKLDNVLKIEIVRETIALGKRYETLVKLWEKNSDGDWEEIK